MNERKLLNELFEERIDGVLEVSLDADEDYQNSIKKVDDLLDKLLKTKLSKKQRLKIDRVVSANNACGAEYGRLAYRQGFYDSMNLIAELSEII